MHRATVPCWGGSQPSGSAEGSAPRSQEVFSTLPFFLTTAGGLFPKKLATETRAPPRVADTPKQGHLCRCEQRDKKGRENQEDGKATESRRKQLGVGGDPARRAWSCSSGGGGEGRVTHGTSLGPGQAVEIVVSKAYGRETDP